MCLSNPGLRQVTIVTCLGNSCHGHKNAYRHNQQKTGPRTRLQLWCNVGFEALVTAAGRSESLEQ